MGNSKFDIPMFRIGGLNIAFCYLNCKGLINHVDYVIMEKDLKKILKLIP